MNRSFRSLALVLASAAMSLPLATVTVPAFAGPAETLNSYVGSWRGRSSTSGSGSKETILCKMNVTENAGAKINFQGNCALAGRNLNLRGTVAYIDGRNRYEAVLSSSGGYSGTAVGSGSGSRISFNLRDRNREDGKDYDFRSGIILSGGNSITITFDVTEIETGSRMKASVPMSR